MRLLGAYESHPAPLESPLRIVIQNHLHQGVGENIILITIGRDNNRFEQRTERRFETWFRLIELARRLQGICTIPVAVEVYNVATCSFRWAQIAIAMKRRFENNSL
jgi:hypothetical protein